MKKNKAIFKSLIALALVLGPLLYLTVEIRNEYVEAAALREAEKLKQPIVEEEDVKPRVSTPPDKYVPPAPIVFPIF